MIFLHSTIQQAGHWLKLAYVTIGHWSMNNKRLPANGCRYWATAGLRKRYRITADNHDYPAILMYHPLHVLKFSGKELVMKAATLIELSDGYVNGYTQSLSLWVME